MPAHAHLCPCWIWQDNPAERVVRGHEDTAEFISTFNGGHRFIAEFLFTEVLHQQPGEVQSFLLHTSILDRLAGSLCNAVSERDDGQHMLETLEHSNLFLVPLDDEGRWYRYHQLFSDFLRSRLQLTQPDLLLALHRRASAWFEHNGLVVEAINHAFAAGDFEHAAELIEPIVDDLTKHGEQKTLLTWLEALPGAQMRLHPRLILVQAWGLLSTGQADAAEKRLRAAEELLEDSSEAATLLATIASMRGNIEQTANVETLKEVREEKREAGSHKSGCLLPGDRNSRPRCALPSLRLTACRCRVPNPSRALSQPGHA